MQRKYTFGILFVSTQILASVCFQLSALVEFRPAQLEEVREVIQNIDAKLGAHLKLPDTVNVKLLLDGAKAEADVTGYEISVPYQWSLTKTEAGVPYPRPLKKHPTYSRSIVAHEYGHLLFHLNLLQRFPEYEAHILAAQSEHMAELVPSLPPDLSGPVYTDVQRVLNFESAYSEFFSDVIAVLYVEDLRGVTQALHHTGMDPSLQYQVRARDFSARMRAKGWTREERHEFFGPARSMLGKWVLDRPEYRNNPGLLASRVLQAIEADIRERIADPKLLVLSPEVANERLIAQLRKTLLSQ